MEDKLEVELNQQQLNQLKQLKEIVQLKNLQSKCEKFKSDFEHLQNEKKQHLQTLEQLKSRLWNVKEQIKRAKIDEIDVQEKLDTIIKSGKDEDNNSLENICLLLGFQVSKWHLLALYKLDKTLLYENGLDVTYNELEKLYDHVASYPQHPEIEKIREFLKNSRDLEGVLKSLKLMFDTELKNDVKNYK